MSISDRIDRVQQRVPGLGFPIATIYKFGDDSGNYLAALIAYYALIALLPLLLLGSTILSFILVGHPELQHKLLDSALAEFPVVGAQLKAPKALGSGTAGLVIGILGATYGALGSAQALQYAGNTIWHVPRNKRPNPFLARARSLLLLGTAGIGLLLSVIGTAVLNGFVRGSLGGDVVNVVVGLIVFALVFLVAFRLAPKKRLTIGELLPGVLLAAVLMQVLQSFGYVYVSHVIRHASDTNAVFATVLGLLAYLYLASVVVVFSMEINVVLRERLWPRALLTPFTDNVNLTEADEEAYTGQAQAQRTKGFEEIDVIFHDHDQPDPG